MDIYCIFYLLLSLTSDYERLKETTNQASQMKPEPETISKHREATIQNQENLFVNPELAMIRYQRMLAPFFPNS